MYGKLFASMFDGSLRGHWDAMVTLQQLVILANRHGEVDMTIESIAARTGAPEDLIRKGIAELETPDPESRGRDENGRRIVRLDPARSWGWRIVNYLHYRNLASEEDRRDKATIRQRRHRESVSPSRSVTRRHALSRPSRQADADADADADAEEVESKATARSPQFRFAVAGDPPPPGSADGFPGLHLTNGHQAHISAPWATTLVELHPGIDVPAQMRSMAAWLIANPTRRKTPRGISRFVVGWLGKEQNRARGSNGPTPRTKPADEAYLEQFTRKKGGSS